MRKLHPIPALAAVLLALALAATAQADRVPPGVSGANQYTESLPGPGGEEATRDLGGRGGRQPAQVIGKKNAGELESLGPEGEAAAKLAAATAPSGGAAGGGAAGGGRAGAGGGIGTAAASGGSSGADQVVGQITGTSGSGGMGLLLPLLIAAGVLAAGAYALLRRRTAGGHD